MAEVTQMPPKHRKRKPENALKPPAEPEAAPTSAPSEETEAAPPTQAPHHPNKFARGKPKADTPPKQDPQFFELVRAVPKDDWGTRAWIYVYVTEPICEANTFGKYSYLVKLSQPIFDLQPLMEDYGSFKGYLTLNLRKQGESQSQLKDTFSFTIYNPRYPPKLPPAAWMNDQRNRKWTELLPKDPPKPEPAPAAADPAKMFEVFERITDRAEARYARDEPDPAPDPTEQLSSVADVAEKLLRLANPQGSNKNAMEEYLLRRLESSEDRANKLMEKLFEARTAPPTAAADPMAMFDQIMDRADKIRERVAPEANNGAEAVRASRMNGWQEFGLEIARGLFGSPAVAQLAQGFVIWAMSKNNGQQPAANQPTSGQQPQPQAAGALPPAPANLDPGAPPMKLTPQQLSTMIGPQLISPVMIHLTDRDKDGYDLADWVIAGKGKDAFEFLRNHGPEVIIESFRLSPYWQPQGNGTPGLGSMEPQLRELVNEFCSWPPPDEDEHEEDKQPQTAAPINLMDDAGETGE